MSFEIREMFVDEAGFDMGFDIEHVLWTDGNQHLILSECFNTDGISCGIVVFEEVIA